MNIGVQSREKLGTSLRAPYSSGFRDDSSCGGYILRQGNPAENEQQIPPGLPEIVAVEVVPSTVKAGKNFLMTVKIDGESWGEEALPF